MFVTSGPPLSRKKKGSLKQKKSQNKLNPLQLKQKLLSDVNDLIPIAPQFKQFDPVHTYSFPLGGYGPYLCTQGVCGQLTHFYPATYHAIDFRCPVGTPVIAVANGTIVNIKDDNNTSGIHVNNLFLWNSVTLEMADGSGFAEYVHIKNGSIRVRVGQEVVKGQILCESGDVGFCPEPHLHFQIQNTLDNKAPTLKFAFKRENTNNDSQSFFPIAGQYYTSNGLMEKNLAEKLLTETQMVWEATAMHSFICALIIQYKGGNQ